MIRIRGRRQILPEIPQVSMSDIAFLLLIFFISTTILDVELGIPLVLPGMQSSVTKLARRDVLSIRSDAAGKLTVDGIAFPLEQIAVLVEERLAQRPDLIVSIETHPRAPYRTMVEVLGQVRAAGASRVSLRMASV